MTDLAQSSQQVVLSPSGLFSGVIGAVALGFFALWQSEGNDDDDSSPGGGLMQPVA